jgi:predicted exporter
MTRSERLWRLLISSAVLLGLVFYIFHHFRISTDITDFLPPADEQGLAEISREIARSPISRSMTISLSGGTVQELRDASLSFTQSLEASEGIDWVRSGPASGLEKAFYELFFKHRFGFLSSSPEALLPEQFSKEGLDDMAQGLRRQMASVRGPAIRPLVPSDPLLSFFHRIQALERAIPSGIKVIDGHYFSLDEKNSILFLSTVSPALDVPAQEIVLERLDQVLDEVQSKLGFDLKMELSGLNRFAVMVQKTTTEDIFRISILSSLAIVLVFLSLYRSLGLLGLLFLPLIFGLLAGTAACLFSFGRIHGLTLAFGATLLGVCVDYPIHLLNHYLVVKRHDPCQSAKAIWPGIRLGGLTTLAGFACLALSEYPGIQEVALFAMVGVVAAIFCSQYLLPSMLMFFKSRKASFALTISSWHRLLRTEQSWGTVQRLALVFSGIVLVVGLPQVQWSDSLSALSVVDPELSEEDRAVRQMVSDFEVGEFIVVVADDAEIGLQINDRVFLQLELAQSEEALEGFSSFHSLLWSKDLQNRNLQFLKENQDLDSKVLEALGRAGFRTASFEPFQQDLNRLMPPVSFSEFVASPVGFLSQPFYFQAEGRFFLLNFLREVKNPERLKEIAGVIPGVTYFDQKEFLDRSYSSYRSHAFRLILVGAAVVCLLVLWRYRRVGFSLKVCAPALLACGVSFSFLGILGMEVSLMHVFGMLLIFSMGTDYGIFLAEARAGGRKQNAALVSISLSALFTVLAFGLLALSSSPALSALGFVAATGVALSFLNAMIFPPFQTRSIE